MNREVKVGSVITSFFPPSDFFDNVAMIAKQSSFVVIVDNSATDALYELYQSIEKSFFNVEIIRNSQNLGVGEALNQGVRFLLDKGRELDWIATFDHDTRIPEHYFVDLTLPLLTSEDACAKVAMIGPEYRGADSHVKKLKVVPVLITSGCLYRPGIFRDCGFFAEKYFIDCVDHEFCLRVKRRGLCVVQNLGVNICHNLGDAQKIRVFGYDFYTSNHSAFRRYFIFRNSLWLSRQYYPFQATWFHKQWFHLAKEVVKIILAEDNRRAKVKAVWRGILAGIFEMS